MNIKIHEIESIVENILDHIKDEFGTHLSKESEFIYALEFLQSKIEDLDIEDFS